MKERGSPIGDDDRLNRAQGLVGFRGTWDDSQGSWEEIRKAGPPKELRAPPPKKGTQRQLGGLQRERERP